MSMTSCKKCGDVYDTDFQLCADTDGNCICDNCFEKEKICINPKREILRLKKEIKLLKGYLEQINGEFREIENIVDQVEEKYMDIELSVLERQFKKE